MSLSDAVAAVMFAGVLFYSVFGGADFGSGFWDLTAGDTERGGRRRRLIDHAIGPVWEANHVWLIFVLVFLWTAFPSAYASLIRTLAIPFWLAGFGIVLRGASFVFRKFAGTVEWARVAGVLFAGSSIITPFFLGTIAGGIASGRVPASGTGAVWASWLNPTSLLGGVLAVLVCTFLAGVFLARDAASLGADDLAEELRRRSLVVGGLTGAVALGGIVPLAVDAEQLVDGLTGRAAVFVATSALTGSATLVLLAKGRLNEARMTAAAAVASIVVGWGVAQYPYLLVDEVTIASGAAAPVVLQGLLIAAAVAAVLVVPPLIWLLILADRNVVGLEEAPVR